jgi:hypothetical protein
MRAERGCSLILSGLPLILSPQKDRGDSCTIRRLARTYCTARQDSRRDNRERDRHDDRIRGGHKAEDSPHRRSILWHSKFVS